MTGKDIVPYDPEKYRRDSSRVEKGFWRKVRRHLGRVPFLDEVLAAYYCAMDSRTPTYVKAILMGALAYFVIPTDWIPDFIAVFGFTDDAAVLTTAVTTVAPHIKDHHRDKARQTLRQESASKAVSPAQAEETGP